MPRLWTAARPRFDPLVERIVELVLCHVATAPEMRGSEAAVDAARVERLLPAVEYRRSRPAPAPETGPYNGPGGARSLSPGIG